MAKKKQTNRGLAVTVILAIVVLIYIGGRFVSFLSDPGIHFTIARNGESTDSFTVKGAITRDEQLVTAVTSGVARFYYAGGSRISVKTKLGVFMDSNYGDLIDEKLAEVYNSLETGGASSEVEEFAAVETEMERLVGRYMQTFSMNDFSGLYTLKTEMEGKREYRHDLYALSSDKKVLALLQEQGIYLKEKSDGSKSLTAAKSGIIEYSYDGYEGWTSDQIDRNFVSNYASRYTYLDVQMKEKAKGDPLYRLITSEAWQITAFLNAEQAQKISGKTRLTFLYNEDEELSAKVVMLKKMPEGDYKLVLELNTLMLQHDMDRVVTITVIENRVSGIKISEQCLVHEEYYELPLEYLVYSNGQTGVEKKTDDGLVFVQLNIKTRSEDCFYFQLPINLSDGDRVALRESDETMRISATKSLVGVYRISGSTEYFVPVTVLHQEDGYAIVSGLNQYDRIKLP